MKESQESLKALNALPIEIDQNELRVRSFKAYKSRWKINMTFTGILVPGPNKSRPGL